MDPYESLNIKISKITELDMITQDSAIIFKYLLQLKKINNSHNHLIFLLNEKYQDNETSKTTNLNQLEHTIHRINNQINELQFLEKELACTTIKKIKIENNGKLGIDTTEDY